MQEQVLVKSQVLQTGSCFVMRLHITHKSSLQSNCSFPCSPGQTLFVNTTQCMGNTALLPTQGMGTHAETIAWEELNVLSQRIKTRWSIVQISKIYKRVNFLWENKALSLTVSMNICNHGHQYSHMITNISLKRYYQFILNLSESWNPALESLSGDSIGTFSFMLLFVLKWILGSKQCKHKEK